ncbi:hypothetical protein BDV28DRAFT_148101 [Aspergillus coremiiformis]|uniref:3beta-hydroxysteroid 3-dehydrogenase n=1 Tax=Aspergillus coremiiformis TaxID=138285 RepID=A0A5N6Z705_9EURO|nr:hypothetical protein BDV28DRAFT_148101 [Aspergillus coremiiformis]
MEGTVLITGANGSLALEFADQLLTSYPTYTLVGTVRNTSTQDPHTSKLNEITSNHPNRKVHIEKLDLNSLTDVRRYADHINGKVNDGSLPQISAVVCNAFSWTLTGGVKYSSDGIDSTFQVTYLSHFMLVLKLLGSMDTQGRVVLLGSRAHYPEWKNPLSSLVARFPDPIEELVHPSPHPAALDHDKGWERYGTAKLMAATFMNDLNRRLQKDPLLGKITVLTMDPGGLTDSRAHGEQRWFVRVLFSTLNLFMPLLAFLTDEIRSTRQSAKDLVEVAVGPGFRDVRGYVKGRRVGEPAVISQDARKQDLLWKASWRWSGLTDEETCLSEKN